MNILELAKKEQDKIVEYRRHLHENPELSGKEYNTVKFICQKLEEFGIDYVEVEKGGVLGFIGGDNNSKTVMLRADVDALPVAESETNMCNKKACLSKVSGVSHVCGHDAHTSMLLGAAKILSENRSEIDGRVILFFERGEEAGGNILYLLRYLYENKVRIDGCHGMHVKGEIEAGTFSIEDGGVNAGGFGFEVTLHGKGGHGSFPSQANSPIDCFVALYNAFSMLPTKFVAPNETCSFSLGKVQSGATRNIIPESLDFGGSIRVFDHEVGVHAKKVFLQLLEDITKAYGCTYEITKEIGPTLPLVNNAQCSEMARKAAKEFVGENGIVRTKQEMGSESFSAALKIYPGVYSYIGVGNKELGAGAPIHSPEFDIDESILHLGAALHVGFAMEFINNKEEIVFEGYKNSPDQLYRDICYKVD